MENNNRISTGKYDKNNKRIYVGDILKVLYGDANSTFSDIEKVIVRDNKFYLESQDGVSSIDSPHYSYEIIGNIFDNPNLFDDDFKMSFWGDE